MSTDLSAARRVTCPVCNREFRPGRWGNLPVHYQDGRRQGAPCWAVHKLTPAEVAERVGRGLLVIARDAGGRLFCKRALGQVVDGRNFPVVWLCSEEEWSAALAESREADGRPWPVEDIQCIAATEASR